MSPEYVLFLITLVYFTTHFRVILNMSIHGWEP